MAPAWIDMSADTTKTASDAGTPPPGDDGRKERSSSATRAHILAAAAELAKEKGAAHISIEAIAHRAGLSKGGLLYHFPKKDALIRALVELHLAEIDAELAKAEASSAHRRSNAVARTFVALNRANVCQRKHKPDGILLALAENPHLLDPIRSHHTRIAERIRKTATDRDLCLIALLAIEGIRTLDLLEANPLSTEECTTVLERLLAMLADEPEGASDTGTV